MTNEAAHQSRSANFAFRPSDLVHAATWTLARLTALGVPVLNGNRLELAGKLVRKVLDGHVTIEPEDSLGVERLTEAHWTVIEQYTVARVLNPSGHLGEVGLEKLRTMLGGPDIAADETNPIARNTQFELYVGATFALGGVSFHLEEPDLSFEYLGTTTGIAAKRVRSPAQLGKRVKEAAEQIQSTGRPGFVAVNVDAIIKVTGASPTVGTALDQRLPTLKRVDADLAGRPEVLGLIVFGHEATWDFEGKRPRLRIATFTRVRIFPANDRDKAEGEAFFGGVLSRIEKNQRAIW